ncbi:MAG TPA: DUF362 domain-containing protein [Methanobacterium sp.]|nr:DUF362 domain-containing protein [Methanobacterium sp.]
MNHTLYVTGVESKEHLKSRIEELFIKSTNNLAWLHPGELVLIKPALNSAHPYPSTTHPLVVQVIKKILKDRGAKVVIGDQSGLRSVLHQPSGMLHGNSRDNYIQSGMGKDGRDFIAFEEYGWNDGFVHYQSQKTTSWPNGFYITRWIDKTDHIINLPRISTHTQAGATLGLKNMIGFLRDDSRMEYHANGPYNYLIKFNARKSSLKSFDDRSGKFLEKIVEISDAVRNKLRLTLFVADRAQTTFGPDSQTLKLGKLKIAKAHVSIINPGLLLASQDPVVAEAAAMAILKHLRKKTPLKAKIYERIILFSSYNVHEVDKLAIPDHPYIQHAVKIGMGKLPSQIVYEHVSNALKDELNDLLHI